MTSAFVALGSNLCDPRRQLRAAASALRALPSTQLSRESGVYRSSAVGPGPQPDYLNAVVRLETGLSPSELLAALQRIERAQGRTRAVRWGPRTLDLDLLLYGDLRIDTPALSVPHPRMGQRHFVLYPLCEIADADLTLPDGTRLDALLRDCPSAGLVRSRYPLSKAADTRDSH